MKTERTAAVLFFLLLCLQPAAAGPDSPETAIESALSLLPSSYELREESGALFFTQHKHYSYRIDLKEDGADQIVEFSSTEDEAPVAEDPRPPVRRGDVSDFCMKKVLAIINLANDGSGIVTGRQKLFKERGRLLRRIELYYSYCDDDGVFWPVKGVLTVDAESYQPLSFKGEQTGFPDDVYSVSFEVEFVDLQAESAGVSSFKRFETGQYGILKYHYNTYYSFSY